MSKTNFVYTWIVKIWIHDADTRREFQTCRTLTSWFQRATLENHFARVTTLGYCCTICSQTQRPMPSCWSTFLESITTLQVIERTVIVYPTRMQGHAFNLTIALDPSTPVHDWWLAFVYYPVGHWSLKCSLLQVSRRFQARFFSISNLDRVDLSIDRAHRTFCTFQRKATFMLLCMSISLACCFLLLGLMLCVQVSLKIARNSMFMSARLRTGAVNYSDLEREKVVQIGLLTHVIYFG